MTHVCRQAAIEHEAKVVDLEKYLQEVTSHMEQARKQGLTREQMQVMLKQQKDALNTAVSREDFLTALAKVNRSVSDNDLTRFSEWMQEFGSA